MNKQDQFKAIRRTYRIARKTSPLSHDNAVTLYMSTVSAMRTFTGKWDCCEPINWASTFEQGKKQGNHWIRPIHVSLSCTRFLKRIKSHA
jgi:hypothetical protein